MKKIFLLVITMLLMVAVSTGYVRSETLDELFSRAEYLTNPLDEPGAVKFTFILTKEVETLDKSGFTVTKLVQKSYPTGGTICLADTEDFPTLGIKFKSYAGDFRGGAYCANERGVGIGSKANNTLKTVTNKVTAMWRCHLTLRNSAEPKEGEEISESDNAIFHMIGSIKELSEKLGGGISLLKLSGSSFNGGIVDSHGDPTMFKSTISTVLYPVD